MSYWENRKAREMYEAMESAEDTAKEIREIYARASRELNYQIALIYERYQNKFDISEAEALMLLNQDITPEHIKELSEKLADLKGIEANEVLKELESPAYRKRIERLQQLQDNIDKMMKDVYKQEKDVSTDHYIEQYGNSYYHEVYDVMNATGLDYSFGYVDHKELDRIVGSKWSGKNYSERIWGNTQALGKELKTQLSLAYLTGKQERDIAEDLAFKFSTSASNARRLVRTESAYISGQACAAADEDAGIDKYRICAVLDLRTSEICRGMDGQEFEYKDMKVGINYPPFHPYCRTTVLSILDDDCMEGLTRRARDPVTGEVKKFPASMNYKEWYEKEVAHNPEAKALDKVRNKPKTTIEPQSEAVREELTNRRLQRMAERNATQPKNVIERLKDKGIEVNISDVPDKFKDAAQENLEHLEKLTSEYNNTVVSYRIAEANNMHESGSAYMLNGRTAITVSPTALKNNKATDKLKLGENQKYAITYHEFAHALSQSREGMNKDFWKEIRAIKKDYKNNHGKPNWFDMKISDYAEKDVDEFLAEAFAQAKLSDKPSPYAARVLETVDKYFKKADNFIAKEESLRTKASMKSDYGVNWKLVKSKEYSEKFNSISQNEKANKLAHKHARRMLVNRDGKNTEELYAISLTTGKDVSSIVNQNNTFGVTRTDAFTNRVNEALKNDERILYLHNHPRSYMPSTADLNELVGEPNSLGLIICHNGNIYLYSAPNKIIDAADIRIANRKMRDYNYDIKDNEKFMEVLAELMHFEFRRL